MLSEERHLRRGRAAAHQATDLVYIHTGNLFRNACFGRRSKQELVIFSTMKGLFERGATMNREHRCSDFGCQARLFAEMSQVSG